MPSKIARLLTALALTATGFCIAVAPAAPAQAESCTILWTGAVSTAWDDKNNWSPNTNAPTYDDTACLTGTGTYTVDLSTGGNHGVANLVVGDADAHVTLTLAKTGNSNMNLKDSMTIAAGSRVEIGGPDSIGGVISAQIGAHPTYVNNGTISSYRTPVPNDPWGSPVNTIALPGTNNGTIEATGGRLTFNGGLANNGSFSIDDDALVWMSFPAEQTFTNTGTLANGGIFHFSNARWVQQGTVTGTPPVLRDAARFDDLGGTGEFQFQHVHFTGTVPAGQTIHIGGGDGGQQTQFDTASTVAPGGKIIATLPDGNNYTFFGESLTNHGTIDVTSTNGIHSLELNNTVTNAADGTITLHSGRININKTFTNAGAISIAPDALVWKFGTDPFTQAGTIANGGTFFVYSSSWIQQAGATTGNPITIRDGSTFADTGGTGEFQFQYVHFTGTIGAGQTIHVGGGEGGQVLDLLQPATIAHGGRVVAILDGNGFQVQGAALTNHGDIEVSSKPSEYRLLNLGVPLENAADGTVEVHSGRIDLTAGGGLTNHGVVSVDPGAGVGLPGNDAVLTNSADGTLRFGISGPTSYGAVINVGGGKVGPLGGTLSGELIGDYRPAAGTTFAVISAPRGAGTFQAVTGGFTAVYADDAVSLRRTSDAAPSGLTNTAPDRVTRGSKARLTTVLTDKASHEPLAGQRVTLLRRAGAHQKWKKVGTVTTAPDGAARLSVKLRKRTQFQWRYAGSAGHRPTTSAVRTVRVSAP